MVLTDTQIRTAIGSGKIDISPFSEVQLTPNGYDLAIAEVLLPDTGQTFSAGAFEVPPLTRFMVSTLEKVRLGPTMSAQIWLRTSWARRGVIASFGMVDAGFDGTLTFGAFNSSSSPLEVTVGDTFAQLVVEELTGRAEALYAQRSGHYQDQRGVTLAATPGQGGGGNAGGGGDGDEPLPELAAPCLEMGCCECCIDTEMPLTEEDVARLEARGHEPSSFVVAEDGFAFLANVDRRCYFLGDDDRCREYAHRPEGCRLYPLVLDEELSRHVLDSLCPHRGDVEAGEAEERPLLELLDRLARQRGSRRARGPRNP